MFKIIALFAVLVACVAGSPIGTPLLGKLVPQPALAPANTEHAGYVSALRPILRSTPYTAVIPLPAPLPDVYAENYLTYPSPLDASIVAAAPAAYHFVY